MRQLMRAAVLLGWFLMSPPIDDHYRPQPERPLKDWQQIGAFDSAKECEDMIQTLWTRVTSVKQNPRFFVLDRVMASRCVPTDYQESR
jgi:hypothetical protein